MEGFRPDVLIVDSIQTMFQPALDSSPGSVPQVKDCTMSFMRLAKGEGVTVFIVSHVNKDGAIAGPKVLEHMVDCVLYFEGDGNLGYRILRAVKNRFGSTNEIGVFEMRTEGLKEIPNPSLRLACQDLPGPILVRDHDLALFAGPVAAAGRVEEELVEMDGIHDGHARPCLVHDAGGPESHFHAFTSRNR